ncbi:MAG: Mpo1-like protein [Rhizomicrobium sp.]
MRNFHYFGTSAAVLNLCRGMVTGHAWYFRPGVGRRLRTGVVRPFFVEKNRPATFTCPIWSPVSDFRMACAGSSAALKGNSTKPGSLYATANRVLTLLGQLGLCKTAPRKGSVNRILNHSLHYILASVLSVAGVVLSESKCGQTSLGTWRASLRRLAKLRERRHAGRACPSANG